MNNRRYYLVLFILLELTLAMALGQEAGAGEPASEEPTAVEAPQKEPLPQSDEVIDQIAGDVEIRADQVVRRAKLQFGELEIKGTVLEDVQMIAGEIEVEGRVNDRVALVFGEVDISGYVGPGGVDVKFGEVTVSGVVEGPVNVEFGDVRVRGDGVIRGNVSGQFTTRRGDSDRARREVMRERRRRGMSWLGNWLSDVGRPFLVFIGLMTLIGLAAIILIIATLFRNTIQKGSTLMQTENLAWNLLWGGVAILMFVPLFVLLCVTIIGIPLALLLLFLYPVAWMFGLILLADHLGDWILTHLIKSQSNFLVGTIFGIIVLGISMAVPVFGGILMIVYTLLAFGLSFQLMFGYFQNRGKDEPPPPPEAEATA